MGTRQETGLLVLCLLLAAVALVALARSRKAGAVPATIADCRQPVELAVGKRHWLLCRAGGRNLAELLAARGVEPCPKQAVPVPARSLVRVAGRCRSTVRPMPGAHLLLLGLTIDVNSATGSDLEALPGIGPSLARRIIAERTRRGCFSTAAELLDVKGIGPVRLERISSHISLGSCAATLDDSTSQTYNASSKNGVSPGVPDRDPRQDR